MAHKQVLLYLARHGTTALNAAGCFRGKVDAPLDAQGHRDAEKLAFYFEPIEIAHVFSSDRKRTRQTAAAVLSRKDGVDHSETDALRAWNVGMFSGKPKDKENITKLKRYIDNPDLPIPEGESLNEFKARVRPVIWSAIELSDKIGEPVLLVVHSSIVHEVGDMFHSDHCKVLVKPGGVAAVYVENGEIKAEPIFKPIEMAPGTNRADTIS